MDKRVVTYARLHQGLYFPAAGDLGAVLPPMSKSLEQLSMHTDGQSLHIQFKYKGIKHEALIPSANTIIMVLAPEEPKPAVAMKVAK